MMYDGWGWGGWVLMSVVMVLFWAAVIAAIVVAIRYLAGSGGGSGPPRYEPPRPEDVLAGRFARGEIDEDEYRRRITLLREHR
jgi:putative membrane protein